MSPNELGPLLEPTRPWLLPLARELTRDLTAADDLVQDTFVRALANAAKFDGRNLGAWLRTMCRRIHFSRRRQDKLHRIDGHAMPLDVAPVQESRVRLVEALQIVTSMDPARAEVIMLVADGMKYREIAKALGLPSGTVMSRLARVRAELIKAESA